MLTLVAVSVVGSFVGLGLHVWFAPWTSAIAVVIGSLAGLALSQALGASVLVGFGAGAAFTMLVLGVRALVSILRTLRHPPSFASTGVWSR